MSSAETVMSGSSFRFIAFCNKSELAVALEAAGLDTIYIDLEKIGKAERQSGTPSWITDHVAADISDLRRFLSSSRLGVRLNPLGSYTKAEIKEAIDRGADLLMLPMFRTLDEVDEFLGLVNNRVKVDLLEETKESLSCIRNFVPDKRVNSVHFGINDLSMDFGLKFMFEVIDKNLLKGSCEHLHSRGITIGIGGVGHLISEPLSAECILAKHIRHKSSQAILSRSFLSSLDYSSQSHLIDSASTSLSQLHKCADHMREVDSKTLAQYEQEFSRVVKEVVMN